MRARSSANAELASRASFAWGAPALPRRLCRLALLPASLACWTIMILGTGCSFLKRGSSDLRFVNVSLANHGGTTAGQSAQLMPKLLVITLATERDLGVDFKKTGANPHVDARTCSRDSTPVRIFAKIPTFGELDPYEYVPGVREADDAFRKSASREIYLYHVTFNDRSDRPDDEYGAYDLRRDAQDVCIKIIGNPMLGVGVSTNEVVVPRDAIAAALKAGQP